MGQYLRLAIVSLAQMASGERNEDILKRGMPRRQTGECRAATLQQRQERRQRDVRLFDRQTVAIYGPAGSTDRRQTTQVRFFKRCPTIGQRKIDDVFSTELLNQLLRRPKGDRLAVIDNGDAVAKPLGF